MRARRTEFMWGLLAGASLTALVSAVGGAPREVAAATAAAGGATSASRVVLDNARVRVKDVTFAPGVLDAGMHTHALPHVGVILTPGRLVFTEPGQAPETVTYEAGSVGYREANVTHQVANPGPEPMRVIEVELK